MNEVPIALSITPENTNYFLTQRGYKWGIHDWYLEKPGSRIYFNHRFDRYEYYEFNGGYIKYETMKVIINKGG